VDSILVETLDPEGPYGAKECGQGPLLPVIPALTNALFDALGVDVDEVPVTPEKIVAALEDRYRAPRMPEHDYPELVVVPPLDPATLPSGVRQLGGGERTGGAAGADAEGVGVKGGRP
jgi:hypothetical protein